MKFSMTGQEKGDLLIQVTSWAGLTVYIYCITVQIHMQISSLVRTTRFRNNLN
jgi:hypothetical protein